MLENFRSLRVLVVEDESLIRWAITETLTQAGHVVTEVEDGAGAISVLTAPPETIDAVVLDYRLPDSNDLNLLSKIRKMSPRSIVVLMTAFGTPEIAAGALDLGASRIIYKPFEMRDLEQHLVQACGSRTA